MNKKYLTLGFLGVILTVLLLKRCDNKKIKEITDEQLKPEEKTAVIVDTNTGRVTTISRGNTNRNKLRPPFLRGRQPQSSEIPPEVVKQTDGARDIRISIDDRGNVTYTYRVWGFEFSPEVGVCYAASHTGVTVNDSFFFYRKHEALIGFRFAITGSKEIRPYLGYAYSPKFKYLNNTALVIGVDLDKELVLGTSTKF
jgi:hypothetical protein